MMDNEVWIVPGHVQWGQGQVSMHASSSTPNFDHSLFLCIALYTELFPQVRSCLKHHFTLQQTFIKLKLISQIMIKSKTEVCTYCTFSLFD